VVAFGELFEAPFCWLGLIELVTAYLSAAVRTLTMLSVNQPYWLATLKT
jgi:hypothetical protein